MKKRPIVYACFLLLLLLIISGSTVIDSFCKPQTFEERLKVYNWKLWVNDHAQAVNLKVFDLDEECKELRKEYRSRQRQELQRESADGDGK